MIHYIKGDATSPVVDYGVRVIVHIVNDEGKWGRGFVLAVSKRWKEPERFYKKQAKHAKSSFRLGEVQWVYPEEDLAVCSMIAQHGVRHFGNMKPLHYGALDVCLDKMAKGARKAKEISLDRDGQNQVSIHMPRIGCGLGGGDWAHVEDLIQENCWDMDVYVYDHKKQDEPSKRTSTSGQQESF